MLGSSTVADPAPTTPAAVVAVSTTKTPVTSQRLTGLAATEGFEELENRRPEQDDEHGREDQEDEREEDLDRSLLGSLLGGGAAPLAHLHREHSHDLADRDAERLALDDRAHERAHRRRLRADEHVLQRLGRGKAHVLLLERQPHLLAHRTLQALARQLQRSREAEAGFDRHHEQVD